MFISSSLATAVQGAFRSGASSVTEAVKRTFPQQAQTIQTFAGSVLGSSLIASTKDAIGNSVGMAVGAAFPELTMAYAAGEWADQSYGGGYAGIGAALTVGALSTALSYATTGDGTMAQACGFMLTSAGSILGGMTGIKVSGGQVETPSVIYEARKKDAEEPEKVSLLDSYLDSYPVRTAQYLAATHVMSSLPSVVPFAQVAAVVAGGVMAAKATTDEGLFQAAVVAASAIPAKTIAPLITGALAGSTAYYAKDLAGVAVKVYNRVPNPTNYYDPGEIVKKGMKETYGDPNALNRELAGSAEFLPLLGKTLAGALKGKLDKAIGEKVATNTLARTLDEYLTRMQQPEMQTLTKDFTKKLEGKSEEEQKALQVEFRTAIYQKIKGEMGWVEYLGSAIGRRVSKDSLRGLMDGYVDQLTAKIEEKEIELTGFHLSDSKKTGALLKAHLFNFLILTALRLQASLKEEESKDLTEAEITQFYKNLTGLVLSPYQGSIVGDVARGVVQAALPAALKHARFIPAELLKKLEGQEAKEIPEEEFESFSSEESSDEDFAPLNLPPLQKLPVSFFSKVQDFFVSLGEKVRSLFVADVSVKKEERTSDELIKEIYDLIKTIEES